MDEQRIKRFAVPALIGLVLIGLIGSMAYHSGWSQGFMLGLLTSGKENAALAAPYMMHGGHFGFLGGIFRFIFTLLFIGLIFKAMRCFFWRMGGHHGHHYGQQGGWGDGGSQATHWRRNHAPWGPHSDGPQAGPAPAKEPTAQPAATNRDEPIMYV